MNEKHTVDRRSLLKAAGTMAGLAAVGSTTAAGAAKPSGRDKAAIRFDNRAFYVDGKFDEEKGKETRQNARDGWSAGG